MILQNSLADSTLVIKYEHFYGQNKHTAAKGFCVNVFNITANNLIYTHITSASKLKTPIKLIYTMICTYILFTNLIFHQK